MSGGRLGCRCRSGSGCLSLCGAHKSAIRTAAVKRIERRDGGFLYLELFCLLCGDLTLLGPRPLEAEREDERPLLQELLRCRRLALLRDSSFFLPDVCGWRPGDADGLRWCA